MRRLVLLAAALTALAAAPAADPGATRLTDSRPRDGAVLTTPPDTITLTFPKPAALKTLTVQPAKGAAIPVDVDPTDAEPAAVEVLDQNLAPGRYQVLWTATGADGTPMHGSFGFTVAGK